MGEFDMDSEADDGDSSSNTPEFSVQKIPEAKIMEKDPKPAQEMLHQHSRGDVLELESKVSEQESKSGIVQPKEIPELFRRNTKKMLETIHNLMETLMPTKPQSFDMRGFTNRVMNDDRWDLNQSWEKDFGTTSCPAQEFTDRFLVHGEFFEDV